MIYRSLTCLFLMTALILSSNASAFGQGATSSISGTVVDSGGGVIPGAAVVVTNAAGATFETVTNTEGIFNVPALAAGEYRVSVSLAGFKTTVIQVRVAPGTPTSVKAVLEVGQLTESVTVQSSSELVNTQTATVADTLNADQLNRMPTPTRNALNAITFLPGVNVLTSNRNATINGLPESMYQITLDGVSNNDNFLRSTDGFFASVTPRQDAVEAVTVVTAVGGANVGGSGAISMNFTTRSGTNRFGGTAYNYWRNPAWNTNYFFNELNGLEKNDIKLYQPGGRVSGPVVIPGLIDGRNKLFYMVHYEQVRFPNSFTRTRTVLHPRAVDGWFRYTDAGQVREVNVLQLAAQNGHISALDPTIARTLGNIQAATAMTGSLTETSDPLVNEYVYLSPGKLFEHQPTVRVDYNINDNHRLSGSYAIIWAERDPDYLNTADANFPGAPNSRLFKSTRPIHTYTLRSTLSSSMVNELRFGITAKGGSSNFGVIEANRPGPASFDDLGGYAIDFDTGVGLTNWWDQNGVSWRSVPTYEVSNSITWQKGTHSLNFGGSWLLSRGWENEQDVVPAINLRFNDDFDPADGLFRTANFPGASSGELDDARSLYALLTGRVGSISAPIALNADTNQYELLGPVSRAGGVTMLSGFAQDTWRLTPAVTFTGGVRWDVQLPFTPTNSIMSRVTLEDMCGISGLGDGGTYSKCNFLSPGATGGVTPNFKQLTSGTNGYSTDWNNFAPTIGVAWRPNAQSGFLRTLLGDPEQATFRAGYSVAYERQGLSTFIGRYDDNPGSAITLTRDDDSAFPLVPAGEQWPVLLSQTGRLAVPSFDPNPSFPIALQPNRGSDMGGFAPDVKIGSAHTWNVSWQRAITQDMAIEARYIGTYGLDQWSTLNYNSIRGENLIPNGFMDEFRNAMQNLAANNASGIAARRGSFAYFGEGTGTVPLPIYLAYFRGNNSNANDPAAYVPSASSTWASSTFASRMSPANPSPITSANDLDGNTTRRANAIRAGLAANFFVPNPDVDDVNVTDSGAYSDYNALQIELRRRLSRGLSANVNYQFAVEGGSVFDGFSFGRRMGTTTGGAPRHAFKSQWDWTLPVGRGQRFGSALNPIVEAIVGGWSVNAVSRTQQRLVNFGNVRLVGMTKEDLQSVYKVRRGTDSAGNPAIYMLPHDIITNTIRAWNISHTTLNGYGGTAPEGRYIAPPNTPGCLQVRDGDCAPSELVLRAPWFSRVDLGVTKKFNLGGTRNVEVRFDVLNLFDNINFNPFITSTDPDDDEQYFGDQRFGEVLAAYTDASNTYDPGGRIGQFMLRFNW